MKIKKNSPLIKSNKDGVETLEIGNAKTSEAAIAPINPPIRAIVNPKTALTNLDFV